MRASGAGGRCQPRRVGPSRFPSPPTPVVQARPPRARAEWHRLIIFPAPARAMSHKRPPSAGQVLAPPGISICWNDIQHPTKGFIYMKKHIAFGVTVLALMFAATASAALEPGVFDPGNTGCPTATYSAGVLHLAKNCPT